MSVHVSKRFLRYVMGTVGVQTVLVLAIVTFGFLLVEDSFVRWDLTKDNRFTISESSHAMAAALEDPLTIRVYMSANIPPRYEPLQRQVFDVLDEYMASSGGKIKIERYDPDESQTAASEAKNYGIKRWRLPVYEATSVQVLEVYGGIVLVYRDKASEVIDIAARYGQGFEGLSVLEYEISSKIWQLSNERPKIGLTGYMTAVPGGMPMGPRSQQPRPQFQGLRRLLGDAFDIQDVDLKQKELDPAEIPLLAIVRPKEMSDLEVFRLDQFLMKGGRVLMFVSQGEISSAPWGGGLSWRGFKTGLDAWLEHHGLRIPSEFVLHIQNARPVEVEVEIPGLGLARMQQPNWFWPVMGNKGALNQDNPAVRNLNQVSMFWPHPVEILDDRVADGVRATVLVRSHAGESWRWKQMNRIDYTKLNPREEGPAASDLKSSPVVVALEGMFTSKFDKLPPSLTPADDDKEGGTTKDDKAPEFIKESRKPGHLVVVGNAIFISDMALGGDQANEAAKEATLIAFNLMDWLARSEELIAMRAKKYSNRAIKDKDFEDDIEDIKERAEAGTLTEDTFRKKFDDARERQTARRKRWRWINILVPCMVVVVAGALVWILRAARRATKANVPKAVPPASVGNKE